VTDQVSFESDVEAVAARIDARLAASPWDLDALEDEHSAAAEVALFALKLSGKRRHARRAGRFSRLVLGFAMAACVALASIACDKPDASPEATAQAISALPSESASSVAISAQPRASPAQYTDLVLLDAGSDQQPWAIAIPKGQSDAPVLVDRVGAGLDTVGSTYKLAAQPVTVGTRDGKSQFLDPLQPATSTGAGDTGGITGAQVSQQWAQDERFAAVTRAIAGTPSVLDAAYNADAAAQAGGTHTYVNGVVLRVEPDQPVVHVIDRALLESGRPTRAEDVVVVAIPTNRQSLYAPGQVVNLRDVVMDKRNTDVNGQPTTIYVANAALNGANLEMTGATVNLEQLLQPRLQRVDEGLSTQQQEAATTPGASGTAQPTTTPGPSSAGQPIIVNNSGGYRGPSFVDDFLIWMWLSNSGWYRSPTTVIVNNPPPSPYRGGGGDVYYSAPPAPSGSTPSTVASSQAASRSTALEAARTSVSGQGSGTGGGVAATNKSAADATARVSAATAKSASTAGQVAVSSAGKSTSSVAPSSASSSSTASRSAGSTAAGSRGSAGVSSSSGSSGSKGVGGSSGGFGSSGGKGVGGGSSSSSSS